MHFFSIGKLIMSSLFKKEATAAYPIKPMPKDELVRGQIACDIESCIFCGMCQRKCPTHAIIVEKPEQVWQISRFHCIQCGCCVEVCPKKCLSMQNELPPAADHHTTLRLVSQKPKPPAAPPKNPDAQKPADSAASKDTVNDARISADA